MHIVPYTNRSEFAKRIDTITDWSFTIPVDDQDGPLHGVEWIKHGDFYLGSSSNRKDWTLAIIPWDGHENDDIHRTIMCSTCRAVLVDPPKPQEDVIIRILLLIYTELNKSPWISDQRISQIFNSVPFKEFSHAETFLPEIPIDWRHLPVELCVGFELSERSCAWPSAYREFARTSFSEALHVLLGHHYDGLLIGYSLVAREVIPLLAWDVDWPLSRRGKEPPFRRGKSQGQLPWEYSYDVTLLSVYQMMPIRSGYYGEPIVRLRVGGRDRRDIVSNWQSCARALRRLRPKKT